MENNHCSSCGMVVGSFAKYHPFAACLMFKQTRNGNTVDANLRAVVRYGMECQKLGISLEQAMRNIAHRHRRTR